MIWFGNDSRLGGVASFLTRIGLVLCRLKLGFFYYPLVFYRNSANILIAFFIDAFSLPCLLLRHRPLRFVDPFRFPSTMGNSLPSRLNGWALKEIQRKSSFSSAQIQHLYKVFDKITSSDNIMTKEMFIQGMSEASGDFKTDEDSKALLSSIFDLIDAQDGCIDGKVDFRNFSVAVSLFPNDLTSLDDLLHTCFSFYDLAGDSYITRAEMKKCLKTLNNVLEMEQFSGKEKDNVGAEIEKFVEECFQEFDSDCNGRLDFEQFKAAVNKHPFVLNSASGLLSSVGKGLVKTGNANENQGEAKSAN